MRRSWGVLLAVLASLSMGLAACHKEATMQPSHYTNPLADDGAGYADPWVIRVGERYYYCGAGADQSINLKVGRDPTTLMTKADHTVWTAPATTAYSQELWAPELHYLAGHWYIYVAADDGDNANHRMYALQGGTNVDDPLDGAYHFKGKVAAPTDRWAIDGTVMTRHDQLYFIWSGWAGQENVAQNLYIAPMSDPVTISGERVLISTPDRSWERHGQPVVNEGPAVLTHAGTTTIVYSASGSWTDDYCMGQLTLRGNDPLKAASWVKSAAPVIAKTANAFGPGHCSFITSPSGRPYIIYHAAITQGSGWDRDIRMQPFSWRADGTPKFAPPAAPGESLIYQ